MTNLCKDSISLLGFPPISRTWNEDFNKYWSKDEYICIGNNLTFPYHLLVSSVQNYYLESERFIFLFLRYLKHPKIPQAQRAHIASALFSLKLRIQIVHLLIESQNCISSHKQRLSTLIWKTKEIKFEKTKHFTAVQM